jgi:hypothetical protein
VAGGSTPRRDTSALDRLEKLSSRQIRTRQGWAREREARARALAVQATRERELLQRDRVLARLCVEEHTAVRARLRVRLQAIEALIRDLEALELNRTADWAIERARLLAERTDR